MLAFHKHGWIAAAALALSAAGFAGQAQEPASAPTDLIATLNTVCVASQGDRNIARTLAAEAGYSPVPDSMVPFMRNSSDRAGYMRSTATDITFVMTGRMARRISGEDIVMDFCGVTARPTDHRALDRQLREVMGFAPARAGGFEAYAWLQTPEGRAPSRSLSDAQFIGMAETGQLRMVRLDRAGPGSTLIYLLPRIE